MLSAIAVLCWACAPQAAQTPRQARAPQRVVSLSGGITELLYTMGLSDQLVGRDVTSTYPEQLADTLPNLGHVRNLNVEAVLALRPDLIVLDSAALSEPALKQIADSGVPMLALPAGHELELPLQQAEVLAGYWGDPSLAEPVRQVWSKGHEALQQAKAAGQRPVRALFVYARGKGSLMVAGKGTSADAMIRHSGGQNAINEFEGFRALSAEGLIAAAPEALLFFDSGIQSLGGTAGLAEVPGLLQTPAGQNGDILGMDGLYLLGFTPRATAAAAELSAFFASIAQRGTEAYEPTDAEL